MMTPELTAAIEQLNCLRTYLLKTSFTLHKIKELKKLLKFIALYDQAQDNFCQHNDLNWDESEEAVLMASAFSSKDEYYLDRALEALSQLKTPSYKFIYITGTLENLKRHVQSLKPPTHFSHLANELKVLQPEQPQGTSVAHKDHEGIGQCEDHFKHGDGVKQDVKAESMLLPKKNMLETISSSSVVFHHYSIHKKTAITEKFLELNHQRRLTS